MKSEFFNDLVYEERQEVPCGVEYDLQFCQIIDVQDGTRDYDDNVYYFYNNVPPHRDFKGTIIVDDILQTREKFPNNKLMTIATFYDSLIK